jgi:glycosyltransferase involved in cell wall biosynthesis
MVGHNPGFVTTQGEILCDKFKHEGYAVISASASPKRYIRLLDILTTIVRRRHNTDILVVEVYGGPSFVVEDIASWLGRRFDHRIVMHLHGGAMKEFMARFPNWARRVLNRADVLVTPSKFLASAVIPHGFKAHVIPNVIEISAYPYRHRQAVKPHLFWMRSFHPIYNPRMAIRVLARLRATLPEATLVMAGQDKGLETEVRRLAARFGLNGAVRFPGFLDLAAKITEGNVADIFVNTSHVDNMPVALLEAGAMGLPVVSTAVGGVPAFLTDGETGLLVPDDNDEAMLNAIHRLLTTPDLAALLSVNGRRLAERTSWEQAGSQWERLFTAVMADSNQSTMEKR